MNQVPKLKKIHLFRIDYRCEKLLSDGKFVDLGCLSAKYNKPIILIQY